MDNKEKERIINALQKFRSAYFDLLYAITESHTIDINDIKPFIAYYPFDKSFDGVEISEWVDETIDELRRRK